MNSRPATTGDYGAIVDLLVAMAFEAHELTHDLWIGLAVEAMVVRAGAAEHFD